MRISHSPPLLCLLSLLAPLAACSSGEGASISNEAPDASHDSSSDFQDSTVQDTSVTPDSSSPPDSDNTDTSSDSELPDTSVLVDSSPSDSSPIDSGKDSALDAPNDSPLPYPTRTDYRIKGLQPDFWANKDDVVGNNTGGVAMNLVWTAWEGNVKAPPCGALEELYDGHCFVVDTSVDDAIRSYTSRGVVVTAVTYGVPAWARIKQNCSPVSAGFDIFCAPEDPVDYGRFAGMLARRYDGKHGNGRIADFVIHNEVNANDWFDIGCGQGKACDQNAWIDAYAANYIAAYDRILAEQPNDKVLVSLEHHFGTTFDQPSAQNPLISGMTFLTGMVSRVGNRDLRVAYHPYPPNLLAPEFGPDDFPRVTYGNIGVLSGWLQKTFPGKPSLAQIQLTESGVNSIAPNSNQQAQADGVCRSLRNVLGTPSIENYIYHRMKDHPDEVAQGLGLGLHDDKGAAKLAWAVWALANRNDLSPPKLDCGFENLPYVKLSRSSHKTRGHWASSRLPPSGFTVESSWHILRNPASNTKPLYECKVGEHNLLSPDVQCEGQFPMGPVGYIYTTQVPNSLPLYRCSIGAAADHFVSPSATCEGQKVEQNLGYVLP